ncbi:hypothetical protein D6D28_06951 [Aureobasidium pullulans]|uniref:MINDY deubiquitinase domain-containing protein n=1 Tax=Aureobasidium pullulans TaxID=5580 RepID=A0A4S8SCF9_AURPU|nr:hypothetical protein D6D28_06951 [Aureobasidium pullulans]
MVTRKPVPSRNPEQPSSAPYPTSPTAPSASNGHASAYQPPLDNDSSLQRTRSSSASSHNTWNSGFSSDHEDEQVHGHDQPNPESSAIPASLRVGRPHPSELPQPDFQSHNPYHNLHSQSQPPSQPLPYPSEDTQSIWSSSPAPPTAPPPAPPSQPPPSLPPAPAFAALSLDDYGHSNGHTHGLEPPPPEIPQKSSRRSLVSQTSSNPWQQDLDREQHIQNPWNPTPSPQPGALFQPPAGPPPSFVPPASPSNFQSTPSPPPASAPSPLAFNAPSAAPSAPSLPPTNQQYDTSLNQRLPPSAPPAPPAPRTPAQSEAFPVQSHSVHPVQQEESLIDFGTDHAPPPPAPISEPVDPPESERTNNLAAPIESAEELLKKQRNETYQIKQINWFDAAAGPNGSMRRSPILTQNANGPCPLLALVNALTLSAPESPKTILVDTLSSREQISLGLLLDAVFEELARRTEISKKALPDVGDLYSFLITLHTGMNVNPRFVLPQNDPQGLPGSFDETREMRLYSTFDVPLLHGWVPPSSSPAYEAFDRSAKTFDDALNIQFAQAELEHKLGTDGLSNDEQQMFEDIIFIKEFLSGYPTQLTEHGLKLMADFLRPGQVAILFRNDHFSTLYKQPRTGTLMNLVTDAGYSSHDEIVWESLVDVSGAAGSFFSGDFRPVGNTSATQGGEDDWQTVPSRNNRSSHSGVGASASSSAAPSTSQSHAPPEPRGHGSEQEDADLALALQLQEEEEDNQRRAQAARRQQEDELSRQFLERESASSGQSPSSEQRPPVPPRRSNMGNVPNSSSSHNNPPPTADAPYIRERDDGDDEPPTYEQAASDRPFRPAGATREPRQGDALGALTALQMQQGPFANQSNASSQPPSMHRRRSSAMNLGRTNSNSQRLRRQQSQGQGQGQGQGPQAAAVAAGPQAAPQYSGYVPPGSGGRISQAEREERCNVM